MKKCSKCGKKFNNKQEFCSRCGEKLEIVEVDAKQQTKITRIIIAALVLIVVILGCVICAFVFRGTNSVPTTASLQQQFDEEGFKKSCSYASYKTLIEKSDELKDTHIAFVGKIYSVTEPTKHDKNYLYKIQITGDILSKKGDYVMVSYTPSENEVLKKDDIITVWGIYNQLFDYKQEGNEKEESEQMAYVTAVYLSHKNTDMQYFETTAFAPMSPESEIADIYIKMVKDFEENYEAGAALNYGWRNEIWEKVDKITNYGSATATTKALGQKVHGLAHSISRGMLFDEVDEFMDTINQDHNEIREMLTRKK